MNRKGIEYSFIVLVVLSVAGHKFNGTPSWAAQVTVTLWAIFAISGFFIPTTTQSFSFSAPGVSERLLPLVVRMSSVGGFIAGQKVTVHADIQNLNQNDDSKAAFRNAFARYDIVWLKSQKFPPRKGGQFLEGQPEAGGVSIDMATCRGIDHMVFLSPGLHNFTILYKPKNTSEEHSWNGSSKEIETALSVSPAEYYVQFRLYSITYGLTLVVLLLSALAAGLI